MNLPSEELQRKLERITEFEREAGREPPLEDTDLRVWRQIWGTFTRLLDLAEQRLPEPNWGLPRVGMGKGHLRERGGSRWGKLVCWAGLAGAILALIGGGILEAFWSRGCGLWATDASLARWLQNDQKISKLVSPWTGQLRPSSASEALEGNPRPPSSAISLPQQRSAISEQQPQALSNLRNAQSDPSVTALLWEDNWEESLLFISRVSLSLQTTSSFQEDPFIVVRQKLAEIQEDLDQSLL